MARFDAVMECNLDTKKSVDHLLSSWSSAAGRQAAKERCAADHEAFLTRQKKREERKSARLVAEKKADRAYNAKQKEMWAPVV